MFYREYPPSLFLSRYVRCYWILRAASNPFPTTERLIPDGTIELIFNFDSPYRRNHAGASGGGNAELIKDSHVVGTRGQAFLIEQFGAIYHVAVRFKSGGLRAFVPFPVNEITDLTADTNQVFGVEAHEIEARLFDAPDDTERVHILEGFLAKRLRDNWHEPLVHGALTLISNSNGSISMKALMQQLDCNIKRLERQFLAHTGITPKLYARIARFMSVFDMIRCEPQADWAAIATACGYYDQAHFIKNFKEMTGTTPSEFFAQRNYIAEMITATPALSTVSNSYNTVW